MKFLWIERLNIEKDAIAKEYRRDVKRKEKVSQGVNRYKDIQNNSQQVHEQETKFSSDRILH